MKTLILGGVRSGKSRLAERFAVQSTLPVTYIATATAQDDEMQARINEHQMRRPSHWSLVEEPLYLSAILRQHDVHGTFLLVDCLTLWLTNLLIKEDEALFKQERASLLATLPTLSSQIILVSNETNMGITPLGELSRRYCDEAGSLHQELAHICERVILTVAGLPHILKGDSI